MLVAWRWALGAGAEQDHRADRDGSDGGEPYPDRVQPAKGGAERERQSSQHRKPQPQFPAGEGLDSAAMGEDGEQQRVGEVDEHGEADRNVGDRADEAVGHERVGKPGCDTGQQRRPWNAEGLARDDGHRRHECNANHASQRRHGQRVAPRLKGEPGRGWYDGDRGGRQQYEERAVQLVRRGVRVRW